MTGPELRELVELREDAAALAAALARLCWQRVAGLPISSLREVLRGHRLACSADGLAQAREALAAAEGKPARTARLAALCAFLERSRALELESGAAQELFELSRRPLVRPPGDAGLHGALPAVAVERDLPVVRARDKRAELEAALAAALEPADGARGALFDARRSVAAPAQRELDAGAAAALLDATDAVARDLGGWLLARTTQARGAFERHDLLFLIEAPPCASAFPRGELQRTVRRWAEMFQLDLPGVRIDEDERPLRAAGAHAVALDPPYEARISLSPAEGPRALAQLLGATGEALLRTGPGSGAPPEDLWFGDGALVHAARALLEGLVREPEFLRRCAKAELRRDDERAIAVAGLFDARLAAARILAAQEAQAQGLGARTAEIMREQFHRATSCALPRGLALRELAPDDVISGERTEGGDELRGRALAAAMRRSLRERFDEDWYRNPRARAALNSLWARGGRPTAAELWAELGVKPGTALLAEELLFACR